MVNTKMKCTICGHIYDPKKGDEGVNAGTPFTEISKDWRCPICGAEKSKFIEI